MQRSLANEDAKRRHLWLLLTANASAAGSGAPAQGPQEGTCLFYLLMCCRADASRAQDEHVSIAALAGAPLAWPCPTWLQAGGPAEPSVAAGEAAAGSVGADARRGGASDVPSRHNTSSSEAQGSGDAGWTREADGGTGSAGTSKVEGTCSKDSGSGDGAGDDGGCKNAAKIGSKGASSRGTSSEETSSGGTSNEAGSEEHSGTSSSSSGQSAGAGGSAHGSLAPGGQQAPGDTDAASSSSGMSDRSAPPGSSPKPAGDKCADVCGTHARIHPGPRGKGEEEAEEEEEEEVEEADDVHAQLDALLSGGGGALSRAHAVLLLERKRQAAALAGVAVNPRPCVPASPQHAVQQVAAAQIGTAAGAAVGRNMRKSARGHVEGFDLGFSRCHGQGAPAQGGCGRDRRGSRGAAGRAACPDGLGHRGQYPGAHGVAGSEQSAMERNPVFVRRGGALVPVEEGLADNSAVALHSRAGALDHL